MERLTTRQTYRELRSRLWQVGPYALPILITKPIRSAPPPLDIGFHTGNMGMTFGLVAGAIGTYAEIQANRKKEPKVKSYTRLRKEMLALALTVSAASNLVIEHKNVISDVYATTLNRSKTPHIPTPDPVDIGYGFVGGMLSAHLMTKRLRNRGLNTEAQTVLDRPTTSTPPPNKSRVTLYSGETDVKKPKGNPKNKRKIQNNSRRTNRR